MYVRRLRRDNDRSDPALLGPCPLVGPDGSDWQQVSASVSTVVLSDT